MSLLDFFQFTRFGITVSSTIATSAPGQAALAPELAGRVVHEQVDLTRHMPTDCMIGIRKPCVLVRSTLAWATSSGSRHASWLVVLQITGAHAGGPSIHLRFPQPHPGVQCASLSRTHRVCA